MEWMQEILQHRLGGTVRIEQDLLMAVWNIRHTSPDNLMRRVQVADTVIHALGDNTLLDQLTYMFDPGYSTRERHPA